MRTDTLYYALLQQYPEGFFELIGRPATDAARYRFASVELKETASRIDGVFVPKRSSEPVYFVEAQSQPDKTFYARLFAEIFLYLKQRSSDGEWYAVIVYPNRQTEQKNRSAYRELIEIGSRQAGVSERTSGGG